MESKIIQRFPGLHMIEKDLGELYTYLELFDRTYAGYETEVKAILSAIRDIYAWETGGNDPEKELKQLRNPREAGRKRGYTQARILEVKALHKEGLSVREISKKTGIPKSSVSRMMGQK